MTSHPRARGGFTLIELLIALVLTGLVGALVLDFVLAQGRFGARQAAVQEVQQNARGALELIVSELRSVPPGSITSVPASDELEFRLPRAWGVICQGGDTNAPVVSFPAGTVPTPLPSGWGLDVPDGTTGARTAIAGAAGTILTAGAACANNPGGTNSDLVTVPVGDDLPGLAVGTAVFVYEPVRYTVESGPASSGGNWLYRGNPTDPASKQPLAGPVREFRVQFNAANAPAVSTVEVKVSAESRSKMQNGNPVVESDSMVVFLRNRS